MPPAAFAALAQPAIAAWRFNGRTALDAPARPPADDAHPGGFPRPCPLFINVWRQPHRQCLPDNPSYSRCFHRARLRRAAWRPRFQRGSASHRWPENPPPAKRCRSTAHRADSDVSDQLFRRHPISYSDIFRSPIPVIFDHVFAHLLTRV